MLHCFHFQVATLENRFTLLPRIQDCISAAGAWITDFRKLPGSSVCLELEVPAKDIPTVHSGLRDLGLKVDPEPDAVLEFFHHQIVSFPERSIAGTVVVRFLGQDSGA